MNKLIIFDCDGVLVDSELILNRIDAEHLTSLGYPITAEESVRRFTGISAKTVRQIILDETGKDIPLDELINRHDTVLEIFEKELLPLTESVLLAVNQPHLSRCVASSSPKNRVLRSLEITGLNRFFPADTIFTSEQVTRGKPAPDLFLFAAEQMGFAPQDCLVVEDSFAGIEAALAAKMQVVGFVGGSHAKPKWYRERVASYQVPFAHDAKELLNTLTTLLPL